MENIEKMLKEIKSHRTPPFLESDPYFCREPWRKFGGVGGFVLGWGWFRDEYIYSQATEKDIDMALNEIKGGANG